MHVLTYMHLYLFDYNKTKLYHLQPTAIVCISWVRTQHWGREVNSHVNSQKKWNIYISNGAFWCIL